MQQNSPDFDQLLAREAVLSLEARHRQVLANRWTMAAIAVVFALIGGGAGVLPVSVPVATGLAIAVAGYNAAFLLLLRAGSFARWHFWAGIVLDAVAVGAFAAALETAGYLVLPVVVYTVATYALGSPSSARLMLACVAVTYPLGRLAGYELAGAPVPAGPLAVEWLFAVAVALMAARAPASVTRRLARVRLALARLEEGDLTAELPARHLDDIGFLSVSVNSTAEALRGLVEEMQEEAISLSALAEELAATAQEVEASAEEVGTGAGALAKESEEQRSLVERASAVVGEVSSASRERRESISAAAGDTRRLAASAGENAEAAARASELLVELGADVRGSVAAMDALEAAGERVARFVETIESIARQTNLLALNASIEAARAGEHGRGFSVVAEEVGKLAGQAERSAREVAATVSETGRAIAEVRERLRRGSERLADAGDVSDAAREALTSLVDGLGRTVSFVESVARDNDSEARDVQRVREGMDAIGRIAARSMERAEQNAYATEQQTAAMAELTATSQTLAMTAGRLEELARRFRVSTGGTRRGRGPSAAGGPVAVSSAAPDWLSGIPNLPPSAPDTLPAPAGAPHGPNPPS